jgi:putative drug exporter of the RND superfamily
VAADPAGASRFAGLAGFLTRRARLVVVVWVLLVGVLAVQGSNLERKLTPHVLYVGGTQSSRAHEIAQREFGSENAVVVMLRGPAAAIEGQGRRLADRLDRIPRMKVVSPWSPGAQVEGLTPRPGVAAIVVRAESVAEEDVTDMLPPIERQVDAVVSGPVRVSVAGFPAVFSALRSASENAASIGQLIAVPVLLLVLLFVFRSALAALTPLVVGGAVVAASRGVVGILHGFVDIDLYATGVVGMMGLALGVDYSLLVVSRFREERRERDVAAAVRETVVATSRSILPAGSGLIVAMLAASLVLPSVTARSVALAVTIVTLLSMASALCVVPALLTLLGRNLDRWALPQRQVSQIMPLRLSRRVVARPRAVLSIVIALFLLAAWAFTLRSSSISVAFLPAGNSGRVQQEEVERGLGPGWIAPMEVLMDGGSSPITSLARLRALASFQRKVERDPGVESMAGFARIEGATRQLGGIERGLADAEQGLERLDTGIARLHGGAALNTTGLLAAAAGARKLGAGTGLATHGAGLLSGALRRASVGSLQLTQGLGRVDAGSGKLAQGTEKASSGAGRLADALAQAGEKTGELQASARLLENAMRSGDDRLDELHEPLRSTDDQLGAALQALQRMTTGRGDPQYATALHAVEEARRHLDGDEPSGGSPGVVERGVERAEGQFGVGLYLSSQLGKKGEKAQDGIEKLADASARLDHGLARLATGSRRVSGGIAQLSRGGEQLSPAMRRLSEGAESLDSGLGQLEAGAGRLADGLGGGAQKSKLLTGALRRIGSGLERQQEAGGSPLGRLHEQSPGLFRSSYFVLASLDGSSPARREQLGFLVNLDRGGRDARMLVIPRDGPTSAAAAQTKDRLEADAADLGRRTHTEVVVGGAAPTQIDANQALRDRAPLLRLTLSLVSFLILLPVIRSLTIALLAALLNLVTVSACFGLLSLLFNSSLLGGPGYVDATVIPAAMLVMFGLAIDYEVFVFARIREEYVRTGSTAEAIRLGLDNTAHVVTGAAVIMIVIFLAFSTSGLMTIRNFGVAQAIGVFIDAFIIRLIVVPAAMARLGRWCWWMPRWLDRLLPGKGLTGAAAGAGASAP